MKVYRYMSSQEFFSMSAYLDMIPRTRIHQARTNSVGFCFLPAKVNVFDNGDKLVISPLDCYEFLAGIVSDDVLVEFEAPEDAFRSSSGMYFSLSSDEWGAYCEVEELCCDFYSRNTFTPLRYMPEPDRFGKSGWYQFF